MGGAETAGTRNNIKLIFYIEIVCLHFDFHLKYEHIFKCVGICTME